MTAQQKLIELSSLTNCATAMEHFCSITQTSGGETIFIPTDELTGELTFQDQLEGTLEENETLIGELQDNIELPGEIEDDQLKGDQENNDELKGNISCQ